MMMICIQVINLSCVPCYFSQSMTFLHTEILYGYNIKGHKVCPIYEIYTCHHQLQKGKKTVYLGHQNFLRPNNPYRRLRKAFNIQHEFDIAPKPLTWMEVYKRQQHISVVFRKKHKNTMDKNIWKNRLCPLIFHTSLVLM